MYVCLFFTRRERDHWAFRETVFINIINTVMIILIIMTTTTTTMMMILIVVVITHKSERIRGFLEREGRRERERGRGSWGGKKDTRFSLAFSCGTPRKLRQSRVASSAVRIVLYTHRFYIHIYKVISLLLFCFYARIMGHKDIYIFIWYISENLWWWSSGAWSRKKKKKISLRKGNQLCRFSSNRQQHNITSSNGDDDDYGIMMWMRALEE